MQSITYFYIPESIINPKTQKVTGTIYRPKIPVMLSYNHKIFRVYVDSLIDSGSDTNLFPAQWGQAAGINIAKGKYKKIFGIGNADMDAYTHKVQLYIGSHKLNVDVDFGIGQQTPLLGRLGFFDQFKEVVFEEKTRKVTLNW